MSLAGPMREPQPWRMMICWATIRGSAPRLSSLCSRRGSIAATLLNTCFREIRSQCWCWSSIQPVPGKPLTFKTSGVGRPEDCVVSQKRCRAEYRLPPHSKKVTFLCTSVRKSYASVYSRGLTLARRSFLAKPAANCHCQLPLCRPGRRARPPSPCTYFCRQDGILSKCYDIAHCYYFWKE